MHPSSPPQRVFVTGATGFIGTRLAGELARTGHTVVALCRSSSDRTGLAHEKIESIEGDVCDVPSLERGMRGCTQLYHLAAYAKNWARRKSRFHEVNVEGTRNVVAAARSAGIERVVCTSTIVTFGPTGPRGLGDEATQRATPTFFTEYEETKALAEREALDCAARGLPLVIVNPTRVYGPGKLTEGNSVTLMVDQYDRGRVPVLLNRGANVGNYVYIDDVVRGHILAMEKGSSGDRYILGGENVSLAQLFRTVDAVSGRRHFQVSLPPVIARLYARKERFVAERFGLYPRITPGWVDTFLHDWVYSSARAARELGYTITPLAEGMRRTYEWLIRRRRK